MSATLTARQQVEQTHHDRIASHERRDFLCVGGARRRRCLCIRADRLTCGQRHSRPWMRPGHPRCAFCPRRRGVAAIDLSGGMASMTQRRAMAAGVGARVAVQQMSAESLGFADATFDYVFGHSVLHHTDLAVTRREVHRVLKPGGRAVFLEPLDHNPALNLFRHLTPWRRTPTEKPLSLADLRFFFFFAEPFTSSSHREFYLLALGAFIFVPFKSRTLFQHTLRLLNAVDQRMFRLVPALRRYAWVTVLDVRR